MNLSENSTGYEGADPPVRAPSESAWRHCGQASRDCQVHSIGHRGSIFLKSDNTFHVSWFH